MLGILIHLLQLLGSADTIILLYGGSEGQNNLLKVKWLQHYKLGLGPELMRKIQMFAYGDLPRVGVCV